MTMDYKKLNDGLYWTGVLDKDLRVFDIIMYTEFGTSYNSYVLKGRAKRRLCLRAQRRNSPMIIWKR